MSKVYAFGDWLCCMIETPALLLSCETGIQSKLSGLQSSGVGAIWLANVYSDRHGMETVDSVIGDLEQFNALVSDIHNRGMVDTSVVTKSALASDSSSGPDFTG